MLCVLIHGSICTGFANRISFVLENFRRAFRFSIFSVFVGLLPEAATPHDGSHLPKICDESDGNNAGVITHFYYEILVIRSEIEVACQYCNRLYLE